MRKSIFLLVLLFAVGMVLTACGESTVEPVSQDGNEAAETEENGNEEAAKEAVEEEAVEEELGIGDTINFDGLHITVNDAYITRAEDDEFVEPMNDYFVVVDVTIENTTDESAAISSLMQISMLDANGYSQDMDIMLKTKGQLDGEISAGRTLAGEVAFDVNDSEYFEFIFENPFKSGQAIWKLNKDELEER